MLEYDRLMYLRAYTLIKPLTGMNAQFVTTGTFSK